MGDSGYYYVSYEDKFICSNLSGFYDTDDVVSDNVYYYDELGWEAMGSIFKFEKIYTASIFDKKSNSNEKIDRVTFPTAIAGMDYEVYFADNDEFKNFKKVASGTTKYVGYETVKLSSDVIITSDEYTIVIMHKNVDGEVPIPYYTHVKDTPWANVEIVEGKTFISDDFETWSETSEYNFNTIIKVYTDNLGDDTITIPTTEKTTEKTSIIPTTEKTTEKTSITPTTEKTTEKTSITPTTVESTELSSTKPTTKNNEDEKVEIEIVPNEKNEDSYIITDVEKNPSTSDKKIDVVITIMLIITAIMVAAIVRLKKYKNV